MTQDSSWRQETVVPVPLVGKVTAGQPILAVENVEETYPIPLKICLAEDVFMHTGGFCCDCFVRHLMKKRAVSIEETALFLFILKQKVPDLIFDEFQSSSVFLLF